MKFPRRPYLNIVGHWKIWYAISGIIFVVAMVAMLTRGLNFGVDFTGGTEITVKTAKSGVSVGQIRDAVGKLGYGDAQIQSSGNNTFLIRTPQLNDQKKNELINSLGKDAKVGLQKDSEGKFIADIKDVGPGWGVQVSRHAIIGLAAFIVAVIIYISLRFEFKMAMTAVVEIIHDFVITIGVYALVGREITPATIIAVLTILGYSLYDTIVIFDRVKENTDQLTRQSKKTYSQTVNDSVNQVLVRSINTSLTTLIPIVAILFFGGETLKAFAFPLFIGVLSGTYSSIILAPPILSQWKETEPKYKAYRERIGRGQAKGVPAKAKAGGSVSPVTKKAGGKPAPAANRPQKKAAGAPKAAPDVKPRPAVTPKPAATGSAEGSGSSDTEAPAAKPKQKAPTQKASQPTSKSLAKSRTKGPGSGKKKKKKR